MKGFILAAGFGTRLRPITWTLPKPMVPLLNQPLIDWAVSSFLDAGVRDLIVNLHHLPAALERHLRARFAGRAEFHFSLEEEILGTGGGIRRVRPHLEAEEEFLLVNGDTVQFPHWDALRAARREHDALAALTLRHPPEGDRFTPVWFDRGLVTGFGKGTGEPMMFAGSHVVSSRIFDLLPDRDFSGIVEHAYQPMLDSGREKLAGVVDDGLWFDIGTPQRYIGASRTLREATMRGELPLVAGSRVLGDSIVDETAAANVDASIVGARSVVEGDVRDSIIWEDCFVAKGVKLERCIVAHGVRLERGAYHDVVIVRDDPAIPGDYERRDGCVISGFA